MSSNAFGARLHARTILSGLALLSIGSLSLMGCVAPDKYVTTAHLAGKVNDGDDAYFTEYGASKDDQPNAAKAQLYLTKGMALTKSACKDYLDTLKSNTTDLGFGKSQYGLTVVLATGVLGLVHATQGTYTGLALGSAFANSSWDLYRDTYLLGSYPTEVRGLVDRARSAVESTINSSPAPANFTTAYNSLLSYADVCSSQTIHRLVQQSIQNAKVSAQQVSNVSSADQDLLDQLDQLLKVPSLSASQLTALYWVAEMGLQDRAAEEAQVQKGLGSLAATLYPGGTLDQTLLGKIKPIVLKFSNDLAAQLVASIADYRARVAAVVPPAPPPPPVPGAPPAPAAAPPKPTEMVWPTARPSISGGSGEISVNVLQ